MCILTMIIEAATFGGTVGALIAEITGTSIAAGTLTGMAIGGSAGVVTAIAEGTMESYSWEVE